MTRCCLECGQKKPIKIYMNIADRWACSHYRAVLPVEACAPYLAKEGITFTLDTELDLNKDHDVYFFHRLPALSFLPHIINLKKQGKFIVWECDDLLTDMPRKSPARLMVEPNIDAFKLCLDLADIVVVTTNELKTRLGYADKTVVLPNLINIGDWDCHLGGGVTFPRILFTGSDTHGEDLNLLTPVFRTWLRDHEAPIVFYTDKAIIPQEIREHKQVVIIPMTPLEDYWRICRFIRPSVVLAPLKDNPFNRSKSNLKWLEGTMMGGVVVAQDLPPYNESIVDGQNGYLVSNGEWVDKIELALKHPELQVTAHQDIIKHRSWQFAAMPWLNFFRNIPT